MTDPVGVSSCAQVAGVEAGLIGEASKGQGRQGTLQGGRAHAAGVCRQAGVGDGSALPSSSAGAD